MDSTLVNEHLRWGVVVVTYLFLSGVGAGSLIVAVLPRLPWFFDQPALLRLRRGAIISAAACFVVIPLAVLADLEQPWRMWRVLFAPQFTSAMPYGSFLLMLLVALIAVNLWLIHRPGFARVAAERDGVLGRLAKLLAGGSGADTGGPLSGRARAFQQVVAVASVVVAVAFVAYTGFLLSSMTSFGLWYTPLLGVVFALAALAAGFTWLAFLAALSPSFSADVRLMRLLGGSAAVLLAAHLATRLWDLAHSAYGESLLWPAVRALLFDRFLVSYVGIELLAGGVLAAALLGWGAWRGRPRMVLVGAALALVGLFASRWNIVMGGQTISRTGRGLIETEVLLWGKEGVIASGALLLWALVVGYALWLVLPLADRSSVGDGRRSAAVSGRRHALLLIAGVVAAVAGGYGSIRALVNPRYRKQVPGPTPLAADRVVHSICLACDARCGSRAIVRDGTVRALFGNPYHPASTLNDPIAFDTSVQDSLRASGSLCLKGVSGIQYLYDPYRIRLPLKRTGPRGSGRFEPIAWDRLIEEVVEGGRLFADIGEDREVEGLRSIRSLEPIDADQPELGPGAYQLVWNTGRGQPGRQQFIERFMKAYGSNNYVSHSDLCQLNHTVSKYLFTGTYADPLGGDKIAGHSQLFADVVNSEYMLFFGVNLGAGGKPGVNTMAPILANRHARGDGHLVLIDPYVPHGRHYADEWVAVKPGTDAALVLGMIRWILDNDRFDRAYLENTTKAAAEADGETTWINATYLVVWEPGDPRDRRFLRARDLGLGGDEYIVIDPGTDQPVAHKSVDAGELFVDREVTDVSGATLRVKSAMQLLRDEAARYDTKGWAEICGVPAETIERLAEEFTSHGKAATASSYRGPAMHSMGIFTGLAIEMLNALVGNYDRKGGVIKNVSDSKWDSDGLYDLKSVDGAPKVKGVHISRIAGKSDVTYEETTEYSRRVAAGKDPYPSTRPWYPFSPAGITTEALAGIDTGYPYPTKAYISYYINTIHSIPGGHRFIETYTDPVKMPLHIAVDTTISETSIYADYIVPDATNLDGQYGFMGQQAGVVSAKHVAIRSPIVESFTGRTDDGRPMLLETFLIDVAIRIGMPGYGDDAIAGVGPNEGRKFPLHKAEDYYLRGIANIAELFKSPAAEAVEQQWVESNYPAADHRDVLAGDEWSRAAYLLARGGYFEAPESAWDEKGQHTSGMKIDERAPLQMWHEVLATTVFPSTGKRLPGNGAWIPAEDGSGRPLHELDSDYPFQVVTFRLSTRTKARTAYDYWAIEIHPENRVEMNPVDAKRLGLTNGDRVRITSPSASREAVLAVSHRPRPGVIAGTHHFGHTQQGNTDWHITDAATAVTGGSEVSAVLHGLDRPIARGDRVHADPRRASRGFNVNDIMRRNDDLAQTPLVDNAGGGTVYLDTRVKVEKA